jgi:hypothetical protein
LRRFRGCLDTWPRAHERPAYATCTSPDHFRGRAQGGGSGVSPDVPRHPR